MAFTSQALDKLKFYSLPQAKYDEILSNGQIDSSAFYLISDIKSDTTEANAYLPLSGGTVTGDTVFSSTTASTSTSTGAVTIAGGLGVAGAVYGDTVVGAVWNDYAELRNAYSVDFANISAGRVVTECDYENDTVRLTTARLEPIPMVVTDTYGFLIGDRTDISVPIAVAGRVLVHCYEDRDSYKLGDAVCSAPNGTVSVMTREEIKEYPDRILGYVSCIPKYDTWGDGISVNNRIWIKLK